MAYCKSAMDAGAQVRAGSIVTAMTRNGDMFGIRVSGLGDRWFTAPVNTPQGLFFTGFSQEQANPDMGDSAITETFGIGGAAMIAAPGVTRFVGAGGMEAAKSVSEEMAEIFLERNMQLQIPGWDFRAPVWGWIFAGWLKLALHRLSTLVLRIKRRGSARLAPEPSEPHWPALNWRWKRWRTSWA